FKADSADGLVELALEIAHIVELHKLNSRHHRRERRAILFLVSSCERAKGAAMERVFESQDAPLGFFPFGAVDLRVGPSQLEGCLPGLRAAVCKKCPVHTGDFCER